MQQQKLGTSARKRSVIRYTGLSDEAGDGSARQADGTCLNPHENTFCVSIEPTHLPYHVGDHVESALGQRVRQMRRID